MEAIVSQDHFNNSVCSNSTAFLSVAIVTKGSRVCDNCEQSPPEPAGGGHCEEHNEQIGQLLCSHWTGRHGEGKIPNDAHL